MPANPLVVIGWALLAMLCALVSVPFLIYAVGLDIAGNREAADRLTEWTPLSRVLDRNHPDAS